MKALNMTGDSSSFRCSRILFSITDPRDVVLTFLNAVRTFKLCDLYYGPGKVTQIERSDTAVSDCREAIDIH
jgi:hypothetical protein